MLVKLPVKEGQKVAKGEVIAQLRQDEFQARLKSVQGQLDQARATLSALQLGERPEERLRREAQLRAADAKLANAKTEFDRYARLVKTSAVSRAEYELAETAYRVAQEDQKAALQLVEKGTVARKEDIDAQEAQVRTLEGRLAEANLQLRDSTLRAPYDGVVAQRFVEENQTIIANKPVVTFQNVDEIDVVADVPEAAMAADIRSAAITQMVAEFSTAPGRQFPVRIKEVAQVADPTTQTFPSPRRHEGPSRRHGAARHDGHRHGHVPAARHTGQTHPGSDLRGLQARHGGPGGVGHRAVSDGQPPRGEDGRRYGRPGRNR